MVYNSIEKGKNKDYITVPDLEPSPTGIEMHLFILLGADLHLPRQKRQDTVCHFIHLFSQL